MKRKTFLLLSCLLVLWCRCAPCLRAQAAALTGDILRDAVTCAWDEGLRDAFNARYLTVRPGTSPVDRPHILFPDSTFYGANALDDNIPPLAFRLVPDSLRAAVVSNVITTIRRQHFRPHVSPEVAPLLLPVLAENGWNSWAYFICDKHPDGVTDTCLAPQAVARWRERYVAGISLSPAGSRALVRLRPDFRIDAGPDGVCVVAPNGERSIPRSLFVATPRQRAAAVRLLQYLDRRSHGFPSRHVFRRGWRGACSPLVRSGDTPCRRHG